MAIDPLELETRRRLYQHITAHPGKHLRELQRDLAMGMGALEYHLQELAGADLVAVRLEAQKRFFPIPMAPADKQAIVFLRQLLPRRVLLILSSDGPTSKTQLQAELGVAASTLNYHLRRLEQANLLEESRDGREAIYRALEGERILRLLITYRAGFFDKMVDGFLAGADAMR
jgi:predicted transcriptional regulator